MPKKIINTKKYELMAIISPSLTEPERKKLLDKIRKEIQEHKGEIFHEDIWGMRKLTYKIKTYMNGFYVIFYFNMDAEQSHSFAKILQIENNILRQVVLTLPENYEIRDFLKEEEESRKANKEAKELKEKAISDKKTEIFGKREPIKKDKEDSKSKDSDSLKLKAKVKETESEENILIKKEEVKKIEKETEEEIEVKEKEEVKKEKEKEKKKEIEKIEDENIEIEKSKEKKRKKSSKTAEDIDKKLDEILKDL